MYKAFETKLNNLGNSIIDKLYRFSDSFFDDSRDKKDALENPFVQYIIGNTGVIYLAARKESIRLLPVIFDYTHEFFIAGCETFKRLSNLIGDIYIRLQKNAEEFPVSEDCLKNDYFELIREKPKKVTGQLLDFFYEENTKVKVTVDKKPDNHYSNEIDAMNLQTFPKTLYNLMINGRDLFYDYVLSG